MRARLQASGQPLLLILLSLFIFLQLSVQQNCGPSNPCPIGCCGLSGWCGLGPTFCGVGNCTANCDQKSECDPGWGSEWSSATKCPLNVCCSEFGFCGTTEDFCGDEEVERPSCSASGKSIDKVIGYFESWSLTERDCFGMKPIDIPVGIYTHINFAFATIDPVTFEVKATSGHAEAQMSEMRRLKLIQPNLEIWVAIGGWTFNDANQPTKTTFSDLARASEEAQNTFFDSLVSMMNTYGFDGVDLDWEYPVADDRNGRPEDFENFPTLIRRLKRALSGSGSRKGITLTLPASYWYLQHFDIVKLEEYVDWFNIMSYDLHGSWDLENEWTGPWVNAHTNLTELQNSLDLLWRNDIKPEKVVLGMAYYGRSFTLTNPTCGEPGCRFSSAGDAGRCSITAGVLLNAEIQEIIDENNLEPTLYEEEAVKVVHWGNQWVSFDDEETWRMKTNWAKSQCITGVMVWALSQDDSAATNALALTRAVGRTVMEQPDIRPEPSTEPPPTVVETCRWTNCGESCPEGFKQVRREGTDLMMTDETGCLGNGFHSFCCPAEDVPVCTWRGFRNSGACSPGCNSDEATVGSLTIGCSTRHQSACCSVTASTLAYSNCRWVGSAPTCSSSGGRASCPSEYPHFVVQASAGAGGEQICSQGAKSFCCKDPPPAVFDTECRWHRKATNVYPDFICETSCPEGHLRLAMHRGGCPFGGWEAYCCAPLPPPRIEPRDPNAGNILFEQFSSALNQYLRDPTCPANMGWYGEDFDSGMPFAKRSISSGSMALTKRASICMRSVFEDLVGWLDLMANDQVHEASMLKGIWDDRFAQRFSLVFLWYNLMRIFSRYTFDRDAAFREILTNPTEAGPGLSDWDQAHDELCEVDDSLSRRADLILGDDGVANGTTPLHHRTLTPWDINNSLYPSVRIAIQGILAGHVALNYARWLGYRRNSPNPGLILEVAYWIGREVGVDDPDASRFRNSMWTDPPDRWIVMHFHVRDVIVRTTGNYVQVTYVNIFHGQNTRRSGQNSRVDSAESDRRANFGRTARVRVLECPEQTVWYPGSPDRPPDARLATEHGQMMVELGRQLVVAGYFGARSLRLAYPQAALLPSGNLDPRNLGPMFFQAGQQEVSFVIRPDGVINLNPNVPT